LGTPYTIEIRVFVYKLNSVRK